MDYDQNTVVLTLSKDDSVLNNVKISNEISNFILNLEDLEEDVFEGIRNKLLIFGDKVKSLGGSFVLVSGLINDVDFDIVPTIEEAYDFIQIEEIEKQLRN